VGLALLAGLALPGSAFSAKAPQETLSMDRFLWGLAGRESSWTWTSRNASSGAYGRYQVMPENWPGWAQTYIGDRWADQTPRNQALVVRGKVAALRDWLGSWRRVAYWWLTGDTERNEDRWSSVARGYVNDVLAMAKRAPREGDPIPVERSSDRRLAERGDWRLIVDGAMLRTRRDHGKQIGRIPDGGVVFVQQVAENKRGVLWLKVSTKAGRIGWLTIRRTVPWVRPAHPAAWPKDGQVTGSGGGEKDPEDRRKARPRPR
jgi:hypothetical protein